MIVKTAKSACGRRISRNFITCWLDEKYSQYFRYTSGCVQYTSLLSCASSRTYTHKRRSLFQPSLLTKHLLATSLSKVTQWSDDAKVDCVLVPVHICLAREHLPQFGKHHTRTALLAILIVLQWCCQTFTVKITKLLPWKLQTTVYIID